MAFRSYLINPYRYTHENSFFYSLEKKLKIEFDPEEGLHVLIGNINCNGNEIDALFIQKGQLAVIDFKDYSGKLSFSENNPWLIESNRSQAFVVGGSAHKNPLQQIKTYKFGLLDFLKEKEDKILGENRNDINWGHISGYVLFHGSVSYNEGDIPQSVRPWFKITDSDTIVQSLKNQQSSSLQLTDQEIENILTRLDVRPENFFDPNKIELESDNTTTGRSGNFELIQRVIPEHTPDNPSQKVFEYLKTIIQLERQKSPNFESDLFPIKKETNDSGKIVLDIRSNGNFLEVYKQNQTARFPNDVFVGANFSLGGEIHPLLYNVVPLSSIDGYTLNIDPSYLEINESVLQDLQLPEEYISNLNNKISLEKSFEGKCKVIEKELGKGAIEFKKTFSLGLSSGTWFTAQLYSELNKLSQKADTELPQYLLDFLHNAKITSNSEVNFNSSKLVEITPLNKEQRRALKNSLSESLSVITGPPGTGKTQLILNLLANIIIQDQTAIFASKNNKAVDNVEERLGNLFSEGFLPRFGSKQYIRDNTKGKVLNYLNELRQQQKGPASLENSTEKEIKKYNTLREELETSRQRMSEILKEAKSIKQNYSDAKTDYSNWLRKVPDLYKKQVLEGKNLPDLNNSEINKVLHKLNNAQGFFSRIWFKLFNKEETFKRLEKIDSKLPKWVKDKIQIKAPLVEPNKTLIETGLKYLKYLQSLQKNINYYLETDENWNKKISQVKKKHQSLKEEHTKLESRIPKLEQELGTNYESFIKQSRQFVKAKRFEKLGDTQDYEVNQYLNYIPDDIPWKDDEVTQFVRQAENFTKLFNIVSVTSLSIKSSYPLKTDLFDYVIIDEASQCDIASIIPLLYRGKKVIIIGDDQQLTHITRVNKEEDDYISELLGITSEKNFRYSLQSLYDYGEIWANINQLNSIFLPKHYRCHSDIISFSNTFFYKRMKGKELDIQTDTSSYPVERQGIFWHNVVGSIEDGQNINKNEAFKAIELAKKLAGENKDASIGIITPFRHQYKFIQNNLDEADLKRIYPLTVHQAQGDEQDIIILSLIVGDDARTSLTSFINEIAPFLLNVAVTRARGALHIVGNHKYCINLRGNSPLSQLAQYCVGKEALVN